MKEYYGNYLGICINNEDPEHRGRVQVFIPHIMPTLYENWNKEGKDITLECVGNNIPTGLNSAIIDKLKKILPWSEAALPVIGNSTAGSYNNLTGNFNQTSSPEGLIFNEGTAGITVEGKTFQDFTYDLEKQTDANGNITVYPLKPADGGGRAEVAGINERWHRPKFLELEQLVQQGQYQQAEAEAKAYIGQYTNPATRLSYGNPGIEFSIRDAFFNRGPSGSTWMVLYAAGLSPQRMDPADVSAETRKQILDVQQKDPIGFINKFEKAAEAYEAKYAGYRPDFAKGLANRWKNRKEISLKYAVGGTSTPTNDPASNPDASALPPTPHPFNTTDPTTQTWNDPSLASVTQVSIDQPTQLSLTSSTGSPEVTTAGQQAASLTAPSGGASGTFNWATARARSGSIVRNGVAYTSRGTTSCLRETWNIAGYIAGVDSMSGSAGINSGKEWSNIQARLQKLAPNYWGLLGEVDASNYQAQQGDIASHDYYSGNPKHPPSGYGHAQIYVDGNWRAHVAVDRDFAHYNSKAKSQGKKSRVFRLTAIGQDAVRNVKPAPRCNTQSLGQPYTGPIVGGGSPVDEDNGLEGSTALVQNPTGTMTAPLDTTGLPQGLFAHPAPGAMLWVFFREGNPLFPVYFAASYGQAEWQSMQRASSTPLHDAQNGGSEINSESHFRPNNAGTLMFRGSVTAEKDNRAVRLAHASGAYMELLPTGSINYSPNEHINHVAGNGYDYCLNREEWTQGDDNKVVIGNQRLVVGNPTQANIEAIDQLTEKVKAINQKMMEKPKSSEGAATAAVGQGAT